MLLTVGISHSIERHSLSKIWYVNNLEWINQKFNPAEQKFKSKDVEAREYLSTLEFFTGKQAMTSRNNLFS